jgi:hypothetical protein
VTYAFIGDGKIDEEILPRMRDEASAQDVWYAYQNHDLGHFDVGRLAFLVCGPSRTHREPPGCYPDTSSLGFGWRYTLVGRVDLKEGVVVPLEKKS